MKKTILILTVFLFASCSVVYHTSMNSYITTDLIQNNHETYLVRVYEHDPEIHKNLEILIVNLLRANNKQAMAYHQVFPPINEYSKSDIKSKLSENNMQTLVGVFRDGHKINLENFNLIRTKSPQPDIIEYINYKSHVKEINLNAPNGLLNIIEIIDLESEKKLYKSTAFTDFSNYHGNVKMQYTLSLVNTLAEDLRSKGFVTEIPDVVRNGYLN